MTDPYYTDDTVTVYHGDCLDILSQLPDNSVDAVVTDPPYALSFMGRGWDTHATPAQFQQWCQSWATECLRVLKPGGHLLAFGGTRTWHRLTCAIEDAGFEIRDSIAWLYGSGFPKSLDVSKAIDKRGGNAHLAEQIGAAIKVARESRGWTTSQADRHFCNGSTNWTWYEGRKRMCRPPTPADFARIAAVWPELADMAGLVAEVDREVVGERRQRANGPDSAVAMNASAGVVEQITAPATAAAQQWAGWGTALKPAHEPIVVARKPLTGTVATNVIQWGTGALNVDACRVEAHGRPKIEVLGRSDPHTLYGAGLDGSRSAGTTDQGRWPANVALDPDQAAALDRQTGTLTSGNLDRSNITAQNGDGWRFNGDRTGTYEANTGGASRFFYTANANTNERPRDGATAHPTVKPLSLMRWLVKLVTPPGGLVLDPFAGSGTTAEACIIEHFHCITIEKETDYLPLIIQRITKPIQPDLFGSGGDAA